MIEIVGTVKGYYQVICNGTKFLSPIYQFDKYIVNADTEHLERVRQWVLDNLMPYMTRRTVNRNSSSSYGLKHHAEHDLNEYVSNEDIKYILAELNVKGVANCNKEYSLNLQYPLSSLYESDRRKRRRKHTR